VRERSLRSGFVAHGLFGHLSLIFHLLKGHLIPEVVSLEDERTGYSLAL
jgi:hypothetical protein